MWTLFCDGQTDGLTDNYGKNNVSPKGGWGGGRHNLELYLMDKLPENQVSLLDLPGISSLILHFQFYSIINNNI